MARDNQRSRVYDAENDARKALEPNSAGTIPEIQAWVDKIAHSRWFQNRWSVDWIIVKDGRGRRSASGGADPHRIWMGFSPDSKEYSEWSGEIKLPRWSRNKIIVLHELAHVATSIEYPYSKTVAAHGPEFCSNFLQIVRRWLGNDTHKTLKEQFKIHRVKYIKRSKHDISKPVRNI